MLWELIKDLMKKVFRWHSDDTRPNMPYIPQLNQSFVDNDPLLGVRQCVLTGKYGQLKKEVQAELQWSFRGFKYYRLKAGLYVKILGVSTKQEGMLVVKPMKLRDEVLVNANDIDILDKEQEKLARSLYE